MIVVVSDQYLILIVVYGEVEEKTFRSGLFLFDISLFLVPDL